MSTFFAEMSHVPWFTRLPSVVFVTDLVKRLAAHHADEVKVVAIDVVFAFDAMGNSVCVKNLNWCPVVQFDIDRTVARGLVCTPPFRPMGPWYAR